METINGSSSHGEYFSLGDYGIWLMVKEETINTIQELAVTETDAKRAIGQLLDKDTTMSKVFTITGHRNLFDESPEAARDAIEKLTKWALGYGSDG
jgi:hypothetical protein